MTECLVTDVALERGRRAVSRLVLLQMRLLTETFAANSAFEGTFTCDEKKSVQLDIMSSQMWLY